MDRIYKFPITKCPNCGETTIVIKQYIHGYAEYYVNLDTGEIDATEIHNNLQYRDTGKYAICIGCGKRLFKVDGQLNVVD